MFTFKPFELNSFSDVTYEPIKINESKYSKILFLEQVILYQNL